MDSLDVNDTSKRPIKRHFCLWWNRTNAYNPRKHIYAVTTTKSGADPANMVGRRRLQ